MKQKRRSVVGVRFPVSCRFRGLGMNTEMSVLCPAMLFQADLGLRGQDVDCLCETSWQRTIFFSGGLLFTLAGGAVFCFNASHPAPVNHPKFDVGWHQVSGGGRPPPSPGHPTCCRYPRSLKTTWSGPLDPNLHSRSRSLLTSL